MVGCYRFGSLGTTCEERGDLAFITRCGDRLSRLYRRSAARPRPLWWAAEALCLTCSVRRQIGLWPPQRPLRTWLGKAGHGGGYRTQSFGLGGLRGRRFWTVKQTDTEWDQDPPTRCGLTLKERQTPRNRARKRGPKAAHTAKRGLTRLKKGGDECNYLLDIETDHRMNKSRLADASFSPQTTVGKKLKNHYFTFSHFRIFAGPDAARSVHSWASGLTNGDFARTRVRRQCVRRDGGQEPASALILVRLAFMIALTGYC